MHKLATESVGEIGLELSILDAGFFNKIGSIAKKAAKVLAGAFAVNGIKNFGKECLELGSDLAEVQNVVDVTFPKLSAQIDGFAKSAATSFGLSETMAKKFTGTFGSMAEALVEFSIDDGGNLVYNDNSGYDFSVNDGGELTWEGA